MLPESIVQCVVRTKESVIFDDAAAQNPFSADPYIRQHHALSILCMPLLNEGQLTGALYLENSLTSGAFAPDRIAALRLLASQAAMSLEKTRLYRELAATRSEDSPASRRQHHRHLSHDMDGRIVDANEAFLRIVGYEREEFLQSSRLRWTHLTLSQTGASRTSG